MPNIKVDTPAAPNLESYTAGANTVTDNVTGLVWQNNFSSSTFPWGSAATPGTAQNFCATLTLDGFADWRLPTFVELMSIMDVSVPPGSNTISSPFSCSRGSYWSATPLASTPGSAWAANFATGGATWSTTATAYYVRCVR
jgi:hypothetical protein